MKKISLKMLISIPIKLDLVIVNTSNVILKLSTGKKHAKLISELQTY